MPLVKAVCTNCGANLEVDNSKDAAICPMCGTPYIVEKAIQKYNTNNSSMDVNAINEAGFRKLLDAANGFMTLNDFNRAKRAYEQITQEYPQKFEGWWGVGRLEIEREKTTHETFDMNPEFSSNAIENAKRLASSDQLIMINNVLAELKKQAKEHNERKKRKKEEELNKKKKKMNECFENINDMWSYLVTNDFCFKGKATNGNKNNYCILANHSKPNEIMYLVYSNDNDYPSVHFSQYHIDGWDEMYRMHISNYVMFDIEYGYGGYEKALTEFEGKVKDVKRFIEDKYENLYIANLKQKEEFVMRDQNYERDIEICFRIEPLPNGCKLDNRLPASVTNNNQGCYIATCVYGSYDCPQVWALRRYRDDYLQKSFIGRLFIHCYYAISPKLVKAIGKQKWFHTIWKGYLDKKVEALKNAGYEDTPYED